MSPSVAAVTFVLVPRADADQGRPTADDIQVLSDLARAFFKRDVIVERFAVSRAWAIRAAPERFVDLGSFEAFERSLRESAERLGFRCVVEPNVSGSADSQRAG